MPLKVFGKEDSDLGMEKKGWTGLSQTYLSLFSRLLADFHDMKVVLLYESLLPEYLLPWRWPRCSSCRGLLGRLGIFI